MELVSPITAVVTCVVDCSTRHLNYLRSLEENLNKLEEEMTILNERKEDINNKVIAEQERLKKPTHQVQGWMQRVEAKKLQVDEILLEGRQLLENRCVSGLYPKNCWSSYKLGKKVVKNLGFVKELNTKGVFEIVAEKPHRTQVQELPENFTVGLDFVFERAMNLLGKDDVQILGLYGVGGVGKTTLLKKINNELPKRNNDFDIIIWVVISNEVNMRTVQEAIGEILGLMPWRESVSFSSRASDIFKALKVVKFLILLDDVWKKIDLISVGIPLPNVQNKSKIILTSRSWDVCRAMEADDTIEVKCLNQEQSWALFQKKVGQQTLNVDSEIPVLAKEVARKCHGLPLVLITVGASMASKKNPREWKSAISDLNKSMAKFPDMEECVLHLLKFSYDRLPSPTHQVCFLFFALYPEDYTIHIDTVMGYWIGGGYISGYEDYEEALNKGYYIIGTLKSTCLLEKGFDDNNVKMHDVIRELALWIACECGREEGKVFVKSGHALTEIPMTNLRPTVVQKISLIDTNISCLKNLPNCPNLSIFFAPKSGCLNRIIDDFFISMPALKILDLSFTKITNVPTSICELFKLEYLDLCDTKITSLPYEMRNLTKLRYLAFSGTELLRIIPRGMMMNFSNLVFLDMQVPKSSGESDEVMHDDIDELRNLNNLKALGISISDFKYLEKLVNDSHLRNCTRVLRVQWSKEITLRLSIGHFKQLDYLVIRDCSELKELFFDCITNNDETEFRLFESLEKMFLINLPKLVISWDVRNLNCAHFRKLHLLFLERCDAMVDLTWLLLIPNLGSLRIGDCCGLQEILSSSDESGGAYDRHTFSNLKTMILQDLPNLQSICSMKALPFRSLESIFVKRWPKLRRLPLDSNSAKNTLKKIQGEEEWWDRLEWENVTIKIQFQSHVYFYV